MHGRRHPATAAAGAGALVVGLCGCSLPLSGVPRSMAARDGDAVVACRQVVQERLRVPDVDGLGAAVDHVRVGERWHGWYVEGVASSAADVPTTDLSCRVAADEASGPSLEVSDLQVGACEEGTADRRCGELP